MNKLAKEVAFPIKVVRGWVDDGFRISQILFSWLKWHMFTLSIQLIGVGSETHCTIVYSADFGSLGPLLLQITCLSTVQVFHHLRSPGLPPLQIVRSVTSEDRYICYHCGSLGGSPIQIDRWLCITSSVTGVDCCQSYVGHRCNQLGQTPTWIARSDTTVDCQVCHHSGFVSII